ncbi:MAG TPA: malto-oligosyltrehalose trehalohydrolase [Acidimicrobiales bacterium]|jgi:maltooligosyltrehalose trehalohydrolase
MSPSLPHFVGARPRDAATTEFCVWAPLHERVDLYLVDTRESMPLEPCEGGYFALATERATAGTDYYFVLDGDHLPDPASKFQPAGVQGPTQVVDLRSYSWADADYRPRALWEHVIYELHVGAFSESGTFEGALEYLDGLVDLGISAIEVMPIAQFSGERNWGYDGVFPFSVQSSYGGPRQFQHFVDECHQRGLAVILDVVYNHLGPEGDVLERYAPFFTDRYRTPWGHALNYDGPHSDDVRHYFWLTARQWFVDYHVDALRLDAVDSIVDNTATPFLSQLAARTHSLSEELGRPCELIAESAANDPRLVTPLEEGGIGMDAQWNDDFHHALHVALTGERVGYYEDYTGVEDIERTLNEGFALQDQWSPFRQRHHGAPSRQVPPDRFVVFAQNHDQVGNRPSSDRLSTTLSDQQLRLVAALVLLSPNIPLLFMGEEYGETAPFPFFVDYSDPELIEAVRSGRAHEFAGFGDFRDTLDPVAPSTFAEAKLRRSLLEKPAHRELLGHYQSLIDLRRSVPALGRASRSNVTSWTEGNVLALWRTHEQGDALAFFNLSAHAAPLAPPSSRQWRELSGSPLSGAAFDVEPWGYCLLLSEAQ